MKKNTFPKAPEINNYDFLAPSRTFKSIAIRVILGILLFFLMYMLLLGIGAAVLGLSIWGGLAVITYKMGFVTVAAGAGIMGLGVMFFIFLVKFIFAKSKNKNPLRVEVKEEDQPELFQFIRSLTQETKTKFPKKVFLSPDVNACVFYNSSFWSLFLPVPKNLEIGLALVNSVNVSEFKGILAHEFGHFSQKSMAIGSYIYTVNRAIYNMVYEYDAWDNWLERWSETGGIFGFFASITLALVNLVRAILKIVFNWINLNYLKLSREMEYHADLVAVSVSGNEAFLNALKKIEFSALAYDFTTNHLNTLASKGKASQNLFMDHLFSLSHLAKGNGVTFSKPRVIVKDQWASHPSLEERELSISRVTINAEVNSEPAWGLLRNVENLQAHFTKQLYTTGFPESKLEVAGEDEFKELILSEEKKFKISEKYNDFYDYLSFSEFNLESFSEVEKPDFSFDDVYSKKNSEIIKRYSLNQVDLEVLSQISLKQIKTKHFEFDGKKYKRAEAESLFAVLKKEVDKQAEEVKELHWKSLYLNIFNANETGHKEELMNYYSDLYLKQKNVKQMENLKLKVQQFLDLVNTLSQTEDGINAALQDLLNIEKELKAFLIQINISNLSDNFEEKETVERVENYISNDWYFATVPSLGEYELIQLFKILNETEAVLHSQVGISLKQLTDFQVKKYDFKVPLDEKVSK